MDENETNQEKLARLGKEAEDLLSELEPEGEEMPDQASENRNVTGKVIMLPSDLTGEPLYGAVFVDKGHVQPITADVGTGERHLVLMPNRHQMQAFLDRQLELINRG